MDTKHTPGPWACTYTSNHAHDYRITKVNGAPLSLKVSANDRAEQRANARLIAATPELLDETIRTVGVLDRLADWLKAQNMGHTEQYASVCNRHDVLARLVANLGEK